MSPALNSIDCRLTIVVFLPAWSKEELRSVSLPEEWFKSIMGFNTPHGQQNMLYFFLAGDGAAVADRLEVS